MAKYLTLWRQNPLAPWPTDPAEVLKLEEMMWAAMDDMIKAGQVKEFGLFTDGASGYSIAEGDAIDGFRAALMFSPFIEWVESKEIVPYEASKEVTRQVLKAKAEAMKR